MKDTLLTEKQHSIFKTKGVFLCHCFKPWETRRHHFSLFVLSFQTSISRLSEAEAQHTLKGEDDWWKESHTKEKPLGISNETQFQKKMFTERCLKFSHANIQNKLLPQ